MVVPVARLPELPLRMRGWRSWAGKDPATIPS